MIKPIADFAPNDQGVDVSDVSDVLQRTAKTCNELAVSTIWLQDQLSTMVESGQLTPSRDVMMALQELDRISQELNSLDRLNRALSNFSGQIVAPTDQLAEAIRLRSLEARILAGDLESSIDDELW